jgi:hypothetical protein
MWRSEVRMKKIILILLCAGAAAVSMACSTPVFRYAIERWEADPYRLLVFNDGGLTDGQQQVVAEFKRYERYGYRSSPLRVEVLDVNSISNLQQQVWTDVSARRAAPAVALLYPSMMRMNKTVWDDELTTNALNRIIMSPARLETAQRLLGGDAAVWLLIRGDDPDRNRAVREMLDRKLRELEQTTTYNDDFLKLVEEAGTTIPKLHYSVLEIDRRDPREAVLLRMLTALSDAAAAETGPLVVPVFGQGRATVLMMGDYIAEDYIERVSEFLTGACACEIKALNPGFDLLMPVDWIGGITDEYVFDSELPPLTSPSASMEPEPESPPESVPEVQEIENAQTRLFSVVLGVFILTVLGALGFITWLILRKKP